MNINSMISKPMFYAAAYLIVINIYGLAIMGIDKWKSSRKVWRIPEKTMFITSLLGGAAGVYIGMKVFRHKTLHNKFRYGIPALLILNTMVLAYMLWPK